ncbi:MAG: NYN domain-containing protein [Clostridia bacterium]|nr:NYN domain-containing protein [Clostridia bacterium]MBQ7845619.1 NYN domain-containing protein [Clostridia bacterium]
MKPLLIVDGYNVIGAWREAEKHQWTLDESRDRLMHQLEDYSGYAGEDVVLVFDGYQSDRKIRTEEQYGSLTLVFTCHGETADSYIERLVAQTPKYRTVRVATSDGLEQSQVLSTGAVHRCNAVDLPGAFAGTEAAAHNGAGSTQASKSWPQA